jgi:hypothetical protein
MRSWRKLEGQRGGALAGGGRVAMSHRQFKHSSKAATVTVAGKPGVDVPPGTLNAILKQSGLKK